MFEPEVFRKQIYCVEESIVTLFGLFGAPSSHLAPGELCPPRYAPGLGCLWRRTWHPPNVLIARFLVHSSLQINVREAGRWPLGVARRLERLRSQHAVLNINPIAYRGRELTYAQTATVVSRLPWPFPYFPPNLIFAAVLQQIARRGWASNSRPPVPWRNKLAISLTWFPLFAGYEDVASLAGGERAQGGEKSGSQIRQGPETDQSATRSLLQEMRTAAGRGASWCFHRLRRSDCGQEETLSIRYLRNVDVAMYLLPGSTKQSPFCVQLLWSIWRVLMKKVLCLRSGSDPAIKFGGGGSFSNIC